jgi:hypothetical protein
MNLTKMILTVAVAGALALGAEISSQAASLPYPLVNISISGALYYTTNAPSGTNKPTQKVPLVKYSYNNAALFKLLNASTNVTAKILSVTGQTNIPSGSTFVFDPYNEALWITNKNGFFFPLEGEGYDFGYLELDSENLIGTYKYSSLLTLAGSEKDKTGTYFYFDDNQPGATETYLEVYGNGTLTWSYGAAKNGVQKATLSVSITGNSEDESYYNGYEAVHAAFSASGSGGKGDESTSDEPFFYEW